MKQISTRTVQRVITPLTSILTPRVGRAQLYRLSLVSCCIEIFMLILALKTYIIIVDAQMGVNPGGGQCPPPNNWSAGDRPPQYFPQIVCRKPVIYLKLYIATICCTAVEGAVVGEQMRAQSVGLYKPQ